MERLETLDAQIKDLEEKLQETIGRQVTAMRDAVLEQNLELNDHWRRATSHWTRLTVISEMG